MNIKYLKMKHIDVSSMFFSGILYIGLGWLFLTKKETIFIAAKGLLSLLTILLIVTAFFQLAGFAPVRKKKLTAASRLFGFITNVVMGYFIYSEPARVLAVLPMAFGVYAVISGVVRVLIYFQYRQNKIYGRIFILIGALVLFVLGILMITQPLVYLLPITDLIGIFFFAYGIGFVLDSLREGLPTETKNSFKRRIRVRLPVFMVALIPHKILTEINKAFETNQLTEEDLIATKDDQPYDMEVFVHVGEKGTYALGHVDIWFEGRVMTYGCYDESTFKLGGAVADGVLVTIHDKEKYIHISQDFFAKTLFGFGLKLTEEQKKRVRKKIDTIFENLYEWKPQSQRDEEEGIKPKEPYKDYSSQLYETVESHFYKFKKGPFKTYFVMNTNCVLLADQIVGQAGIDLVRVQGLITPGAYYDYFNQEFLRKNSFVVSRTIYYDLNKNKKKKSLFTKYK